MSVKWSFSGLKDFVNCPKQYHEVKILKRHMKPATHQMIYGTEVHKALEDYVNGVELPPNYMQFKPYVDSLMEIPGTRYLEHQMALTVDKVPCAFDAEDYWVRGIVDFMVIDGDTAYIVDYKTGNNKYPDVKQLKLMALFTFAHFPEVKHIKAALMFIAKNSLVDETYSRADIDRLWSHFHPDLMRLKMASETGAWMANPTPLCGWCPVTDCQFHKVR